MFSTREDHKWIYLCCLLFWISILLSQTGVGAVPNYVSLARCRVKCLEKFTPVPTKLQSNHERCISQKCTNCVSSCTWLFDKLTQVSSKDVCQNTNICLEGCQVACEFKIERPAASVSGDWELTILAAQSDVQKTVIEWNITSVTSPLLPSSRTDVVYVVLARDRTRDGNSDWTFLTETTSCYEEIKTEDLFRETEIWIRAVGTNGTLASRKVSIDTMYNQPKTMMLPPDLNLVVETSTANGKVKTLVTWQNLEVEDNATVNYILSWFRKDCNVYTDGPYCELPSDAFYETVAVRGKQKKTKKLTRLTFNTEFEIRLEGSHNGKQWVAKKQFDTPFCYHVSASFQRCAQESRPLGVPNTTVSPGAFSTELTLTSTLSLSVSEANNLTSKTTRSQANNLGLLCFISLFSVLPISHKHRYIL